MPMSNSAKTLWPSFPDKALTVVPARYWGVWSRTMLTTPEISDTTTFVRWMQLRHWHADLRVPVSSAETCQGFSGVTVISQQEQGEVCTWHRLVDYLPPRSTADEGLMLFESPERVIETGIHGSYSEIWERLPGSVGQQLALAEPEQADGTSGSRLFISGEYLMRVHPCMPLGPTFEISFGRWDGQTWYVEQSTIKTLIGQAIPLRLTLNAAVSASVEYEHAISLNWKVMEWNKT